MIDDGAITLVQALVFRFHQRATLQDVIISDTFVMRFYSKDDDNKCSVTDILLTILITPFYKPNKLIDGFLF